MAAALLEHRRAFACIMAYAFLSHLFMIINDLPYWDGWFYHEPIKRGDYNTIVREWEGNGRILYGIIFWGISQIFGDLAGMRALVTFCIGLSGIIVYIALIRHSGLKPFESLIAALLGCSFPAYQTHLVSASICYALAMPFFFLGVLLLIEQEKAAHSSRWVYRIVANVALLISYIAECFVVAGLAMPLVLWCASPNKPEGYWLKSLIRFTLRYMDVICIAAAYIAAMTFLMPVSEGKYAHTRNLNLMPGALQKHFFAYLGAAVDFNTFSPSTYKFRRDVNLGILGAMLALGIILAKRKRLPPLAGFYTRRIGVALWMLASISAPFVVAQRVAATSGWEIRHVIPAGFCAAVLMVCITGVFIRQEQKRKLVLLGMACLSFISMTKDFIHWQSRGAFDHSVIETLRGNALLEKPIIFFVGWNVFYFNEVYRNYEWEGMMEAASGHTGRWVIMAPPPLTQEIWDREHMNHVWPGESAPVTPESCQLVFQPEATPENTQWIAGLEYLWRKYTDTPEALALWLRSRVTIYLAAVANCNFISSSAPSQDIK